MFARIFVFAATVALAASSAIPMWEFLTRGEKMSHLFNMFVKQVADHCDTSNMPDCQKVLLVYGLTNLAKMEDDSLDKMDPYQRGANDIIWESMMHGSYKKKVTDEHRDYYADALEPPTSEGNQLGSQEEASSKVENYAGSRYIVGPMVVRVRPDGSPVPEEAPLPRDEDADEYQAMRSRPVPTLDEISGKHHQEKYGKIPSSIQDITRMHQDSSSGKDETSGGHHDNNVSWIVEHVSSKHHQSDSGRGAHKEESSKIHMQDSTQQPIAELSIKKHGYESFTGTHFRDISDGHNPEKAGKVPPSFEDILKKNHKDASGNTNSKIEDDQGTLDSNISEISARHVSSSVSSYRKARHN